MDDSTNEALTQAHFAAALDAGKQQSSGYNPEIAQSATSTPSGASEMPYSNAMDVASLPVPRDRSADEPQPLPEPDFEP